MRRRVTCDTFDNINILSVGCAVRRCFVGLLWGSRATTEHQRHAYDERYRWCLSMSEIICKIVGGQTKQILLTTEHPREM